ncbi:BclA C-terminal domain-containing protein, partial [Paenibacillus macquariensis]
GDAGVTGATGPNVTADFAYGANTSGTVIAVILGGADVPFPNAQDIGTGITVNGANNTFTFAITGNYYIAYSVNLTASLLVSSRLLLNGATTVPGSTVAPLVGVTAFQASVITPITAGSTLNVQLFGVLATATLATTAPTSITIIQLS